MSNVRGLGWGARVLNFENMALFVEVTFEGCIYVVLRSPSGTPLAHGHAVSLNAGKICAVRSALRQVSEAYSVNPSVVAQPLDWEEYPL